MGGVQMQRLLRTHVVVVFGATSRVGKATVEALARAHEGVTVALAVEHPKDPRVKRLRRATGAYAVQCDFADPRALRRVVRNADAVLLVPALSPSGTAFSKRVLDACVDEDVARIVLISSLLATDDYWRQAGATNLGYEAIEAHARSVTNNCVALRVPLLMETLLYCRDEVIFASRFLSPFQATTAVPCIAVQDVARVASEVLTKPQTVKFQATYSLASADVTCSPAELSRLLTLMLGRTIKAKIVSDEQLRRVLKDKGASEIVATNMIRMKNYLELTSGVTTHAALQIQPPAAEHSAAGASGRGEASTQEAKAPLPLTRVGYSNDYRTLTKRTLTTPSEWLQSTRAYFERSTENQMQLFVMGSGEGLFQEIERLVAQQVTAPLAATNHNGNGGEEEEDILGEATIPTATGAAVHSKATFCTIKTVPGGRQRQQTPLVAPSQPQTTSGRRRGIQGSRRRTQPPSVPEEPPSPMVQLLAQLTPSDVVVFVPPLRFGAAECMDVLRVVVAAAQRARAWGIVVVSSIFTGRGWADSVNRMGEMEQFVETSGVPYAIVRLPLFMEYFLALSPTPADPLEASATSTAEEEKQTEPEREPTTTASTGASAAWPLLGRALASTPQYLISTADAAKALVSVAYTFPLHRNKTRTVYTERRTMAEIEACFQQRAYRHATVDFSRVDALREHRGREFWRVAYWTKHHVKQFLETEVALSSERTAPLAQAETFEEMTECPPITLDKWATRHAKALAAALAVDGSASGSRRSRRKSSVSAETDPSGSHLPVSHTPQEGEDETRPVLKRSHEERELLPTPHGHTDIETAEPRSMKLTTS